MYPVLMVIKHVYVTYSICIVKINTNAIWRKQTCNTIKNRISTTLIFCVTESFWSSLCSQVLLRQVDDNAHMLSVNVNCYCDGSNLHLHLPWQQKNTFRNLKLPHVWKKCVFHILPEESVIWLNFQNLTIQKQTCHVLLSISHYHHNHKQKSKMN
jgi:hypothetical protein